MLELFLRLALFQLGCSSEVAGMSTTNNAAMSMFRHGFCHLSISIFIKRSWCDYEKGVSESSILRTIVKLFSDLSSLHVLFAWLFWFFSDSFPLSSQQQVGRHWVWLFLRRRGSRINHISVPTTPTFAVSCTNDQDTSRLWRPALVSAAGVHCGESSLGRRGQG